MRRTLMHSQALERYLVYKFNCASKTRVDDIKVRHSADSEGSCNWDVVGFEPAVPREVIERFVQDVIEPMRAVIEVVD